MRAPALAMLLVVAACGGPPPQVPEAKPDPAKLRADAAAFAAIEARALLQLAIGDPRMAKRTGITPSRAALDKLGAQALVAEDTDARVFGSSVDPFAFRARARALDAADAEIAGRKEPLPDGAPEGSALDRPRLERELFERLIAEERARLALEEKLADNAPDLVRAVMTAWTPAEGAEIPARDEWIAKRLRQVRASYDKPGPSLGPHDLDAALDPLERALDPRIYQRGTAALAELRLAITNDDRHPPPTALPDRLRVLLHAHLGVAPELPALRLLLERTEEKLRTLVDPDHVDPDAVDAVLLEPARCGKAGLASPVRAMAASAEREAICGALRNLVAAGKSPKHAAVVVALHDAVVAAIWALPPLLQSARHAHLAGRLGDERVERLHRVAATRPVIPIGVALAAEMLTRDLARRPDEALAQVDARAAQWLAFGDAPLDVVERELFRR